MWTFKQQKQLETSVTLKTNFRFARAPQALSMGALALLLSPTLFSIPTYSDSTQTRELRSSLCKLHLLQADTLVSVEAVGDSMAGEIYSIRGMFVGLDENDIILKPVPTDLQGPNHIYRRDGTVRIRKEKILDLTSYRNLADLYYDYARNRLKSGESVAIVAVGDAMNGEIYLLRGKFVKVDGNDIVINGVAPNSDGPSFIFRKGGREARVSLGRILDLK